MVGCVITVKVYLAYIAQKAVISIQLSKHNRFEKTGETHDQQQKSFSKNPTEVIAAITTQCAKKKTTFDCINIFEKIYIDIYKSIIKYTHMYIIIYVYLCMHQ